MLRRQFSSFLIVGGLSTSAHYAVMIGLKELVHAPVIPSTLTGYVVGGVVNYILNRRHTFDTQRTHAEAGWRFAVVAAGGFFLTWALMAMLTGALGIPYILAQMFTTGVVLVYNFIAHRLWTFRATRSETL
ncbi:polysaccharide synthesis protein GtrA [Rhodoblastus sphagnicola]|uniref:Polysaccharide synthesis protein GtrA n=1 Tax=Rhodoblastus sphagnicola TaxID=333368 RepID=A0A2S6MVR7_9HYPH|nr:GtrA family protein [Rhodoblastus sphagnicola]MBB4198319.1 putative flippase GtrA [Rhodoblastus sphagnicola]PPQ26457.1 polysaccharide synthesis protein GtrA [Rhodoblastus sphagnicola]